MAKNNPTPLSAAMLTTQLFFDNHICVQKTPVCSVWRHLKTGNKYSVVGHAMIESTWRPGVIYQRNYSTEPLIVRDEEEFIDGRFERLS